MPLPKITNISLGSIEVNRRKYDTTIIVFWDGEVLEREKKKIFLKRDLLDILLKDPEIVIIGNGLAGNVKIEQSALDYSKFNGIELIVKATKEAAKEFNDLLRKKKVAAVFHITD